MKPRLIILTSKEVFSADFVARLGTYKCKFQKLDTCHGQIETVSPEEKRRRGGKKRVPVRRSGQPILSADVNRHQLEYCMCSHLCTLFIYAKLHPEWSGHNITIPRLGMRIRRYLKR